MHGKEQKPSVEALEGRARKAGRASEKAAAAEAAAEAEEAARWQIGAPGKTAREVRAEKGQMKAQARAERREIARREEPEDKRRERRKLYYNVDGANQEHREKMTKLTVKEIMQGARTMEEALCRIWEIYSVVGDIWRAEGRWEYISNGNGTGG